jgi:hypothetical protein
MFDPVSVTSVRAWPWAVRYALVPPVMARRTARDRRMVFGEGAVGRDASASQRERGDQLG